MNEEILNSWTKTYTGIEIYLLDPKPEYVSIYDIAHSLSLINRYNGWSKVPYNVAHHSLWCKAIADKDIKLQTLMHDAGECYHHNIVRPIKHYFGERYKDLERKWELAIAKRFGYDPDYGRDRVKWADNTITATELRDIMSHAYTEKDLKRCPYEPIDYRIIPINALDSEEDFLKEFHELTNDRFNI